MFAAGFLLSLRHCRQTGIGGRATDTDASASIAKVAEQAQTMLDEG